MSTANDLDGYASRAARALVLLQEQRMREFVATWRRAITAEIALPTTDDPDYASLDALLRHVVGASRFYVTWVAEKLGLPDPEIRSLPKGPIGDAELGAYLEHLEERWRAALADADPAEMESQSWNAPWGAPFTADGMLEHAVLHPERHAFQLEELLERS